MDGVCSRDRTPVDAPTAPTAPQDTLTVEEIAEGAPPAGTAEGAAEATLTNPGGNPDDAGAAALLDSPVGQKLSELRDEIVLIHQLRGELLKPEETAIDTRTDHQQIESLTKQVSLLQAELRQLRTVLCDQEEPRRSPLAAADVAPADTAFEGPGDWEAIKLRRQNLALRSQELTGGFESTAAEADESAAVLSEQAAVATVKHLQASLERSEAGRVQAEQRCQMILEEAGLRKSRDELILLQVFESYETRLKFEREAREAAEAKLALQGAELAALARERSEGMWRTPCIGTPLSSAVLDPHSPVSQTSPVVDDSTTLSAAGAASRPTTTTPCTPKIDLETETSSFATPGVRKNALSSYPSAILTPELQDIAKNLQELDDEIELSKKLRESLRHAPPRAP